MMEFETVFKLKQMQSKDALKDELKELGYKTINKDGFLYAEGTVPVLLVAHLDTVHPTIPHIICYSRDSRYAMSPQGIGGDDRAGVYMILQIIREVNCHVLFCEDEEIGGVGARKFSKSKIKPSVNYIIELDRKGDNDAVFYGCDNRKFVDFICACGFMEEHGSFSDISVLAPHLDTAAVNISTGYYNAHRTHEYIDIEVMRDNVNRIIELIALDASHFPYMERKFKRGFGRQCTLFDEEDDTKFLMPIPDSARIIMGECEVECNSPYMMDRDNNVYFYASELDAAIESESTYVCDFMGNEIQFSPLDAVRISVISYDEALKRLCA